MHSSHPMEHICQCTVAHNHTATYQMTPPHSVQMESTAKSSGLLQLKCETPWYIMYQNVFRIRNVSRSPTFKNKHSSGSQQREESEIFTPHSTPWASLTDQHRINQFRVGQWGLGDKEITSAASSRSMEAPPLLRLLLSCCVGWALGGWSCGTCAMGGNDWNTHKAHICLKRAQSNTKLRLSTIQRNYVLWSIMLNITNLSFCLKMPQWL